MSERKWTAPQLTAIMSSGSDLLVSAAAGSGKTAVLTERLIRRLTDEDLGLELSRVLIVTFTRAAAAELRERIGLALDKAVKDNPGRRDLVRKSLNISGAHIDTIHSFCLSVIRSNFASLGIDPSVRVADESESLTTALSVMDKVIDRFYSAAEEPDADDATRDFIKLADTFVSDRDDGLAERLYEIYTKTESYKDRIGMIRRSAEALDAGAELDFFDSPWGSVIQGGLRDEFIFYRMIYDDAIDYFTSTPELEKKYFSAFNSDLEYIRRMLDSLDRGYTCARDEAERFGRVSIGRDKLPDDESTLFYKKIRKGFDEFRKSAIKKLLLTPLQISDSMRGAADLCRALSAVLGAFEERYTAEKKRRGMIDYSDIEHLTLRLLIGEDGEPTETARQISREFDEIYIDEYQDISPVQDAIFTAIGHGNRFMVGDIKQSIYSFRGAAPDIFASYRERFPKLDDASELSFEADAASDGRTIYLSHNFRCDSSVIDFTNDVFTALMRRECGSTLDYGEDDRLVFAKLCEDEREPLPVHVTMLAPHGENDENSDADSHSPTPAEAEAEYVAAESARLIASGRYRPGDIRILVRSGADDTERFAKAFAARGIPFESGRSIGFFERPHILMVLSLLRCIDNPTRDIPLAAVLASPLFGFSPDELAAIRRDIPPDNTECGDQDDADDDIMRRVSLLEALKRYSNRYDFKKGKDFFASLYDMRRRATAMPVDKLIWQLYNETAVMFCGNDRDGFSADERRADLLHLYDYARSYESGVFRGLSSFVRSIDELLARDPHFTFKSESDSGADAVSVMTIHGSKGLEFPVCFVCGALKGINKKDSTELMLIDRELGICPKLRAGHFTRMNTPMRSAAARLAIERCIDEELRILYVALTRAREALYITAATEKPDSILQEAELCARYPSRFTMVKSASYMKWILTALASKNSALIPTLTESVCDTVSAVGGYATAEIRRYKNINGRAVFSEAAPSVRKLLSADMTDSGEEEYPADDASALASVLAARFAGGYANDYGARLPAKLSVSDLHPGILDEDPPLSPDRAELYFRGESFPSASAPAYTEPDPDLIPSDAQSDADKTEPDTSDAESNAPHGLRLPRFLEGAQEHRTGAERGTATHVFMQFCDWESICKVGVRGELARMVEKKFMTEEMSRLIYIPMLERFFNSRLFSELRSARRTWRELRFNVLLPASRFTSDPGRKKLLEGEELLVQGIIDCMYITEDGKLNLLDYKTDRLPRDPASAEKILRERYADQLSSYKEAAAMITGMPVDRCIIYALSAGIEIEI